MSTLLYSFILNLVDVGVLFFAISRFTESRLKYKFSRVIVWILTSLAAAVIVTLKPKPDSSVMAVILILSVIFAVYKKFLCCFVISLLNLVLMLLLELISTFLLSIFAQILFGSFQYEELIHGNFAILFSKILLIGCSFLLFIIKKQYYYISRKVTVFQIALFISSGALFICLIQTFYSIIIKQTTPPELWVILSTIALTVFLCMVFTLFYKMQIDAKKDKEFALKEQYEIMTRDAVEYLSKQIEINRNLRHDMKHYLAMMYSLILDGKWESAVTYYNDIEKSILEREKQEVLTEDPVLASALLYYKQLAEEKNFAFKCSVPGSLHVNISGKDLSGVLMNILENAKNAVTQMPEGQYIDLKISEHKNALRIVCCNPYIGPKKNVWHIKPSEKHGRGLKNIQATVTAYDGLVEIKNDNNIFEIQIDMFGKNLE